MALRYHAWIVRGFPYVAELFGNAILYWWDQTTENNEGNRHPARACRPPRRPTNSAKAILERLIS